MTYDEFVAHAAGHDAPPPALPATLMALWHAEKGNWEAAHTLAQSIDNPNGSWIHANLHREEGDTGNARYWYGRAGRPESKRSVAAERAELIRWFLGE